MTLLLFTAGLTQASAGADWIGDSYINVNGTWYKASGNGDWATGGAFNGNNLGNITSLTIGAQIQVHASGNEDWKSGVVAMNYKIDDDNSGTGWTEHTLSYSTYGGKYGNNMMYQSGGSNKNANYVATFTKGVYAISTDIFGDGSVTVKNGDDVVTSATAGTQLTVILEAGTGYIIHGTNIDGFSGLNYQTFTRESDTRWVATIEMPGNDITIKPDFVKPYAGLDYRSMGGKFGISAVCNKVLTRGGNELGVEIGTQVTLTVTPETGYAIERVWGQKYSAGTYTDVQITDNQNGKYSFTMPSEEVRVLVDYYKTGGEYAINVGTVDDGTISFYNADNDPIKRANAGDNVKISVAPTSGSSVGFGSNDYVSILTVTDADNNPVEVRKETVSGMFGNEEYDVFTMPAKDVTVSAMSKFRITAPSSNELQNGICAVTVGGVSRNYADKNEVVTCTVTPEQGYVLADLMVYYRDMATYKLVTVTCTKVNETTFTFSMPDKGVTVNPIFAFPLADVSDTNSTAIANLANENYTTVVLNGRTLFKDGSWNTICLPFDVMYDNQMEQSVFDGATAMELDTSNSGFDSSTGTLTLNFTKVEAPDSYMGSYKTLTAGKPYLVKWASAEDIVNPYFQDVEVTATAPTTVTSTDGKVSFVGTFDSALLTASSSNLYLGADNFLYWPDVDNYYVNAFRAYFTVDTNGTAGVRSFKLHFGDDEAHATGIVTMEKVEKNDAWYDLNGQKHEGKPTAKGLYINNGKKVVVK